MGVVPDDYRLNQAVGEIRGLGLDGDKLTVVLKRKTLDDPEPLPEGTRYIVIPDDNRGLELTIGFAVVFAIVSLLFAFTAPGIGAILFIFFISLAAILAAGSFTRVGVDPLLIDMEASTEDSEEWNEAFEQGRVLVFASTHRRDLLQPLWRVFQRQGDDFYVVERTLCPAAVSGAVLRHAGEHEEDVTHREKEEQAG